MSDGAETLAGFSAVDYDPFAEEAHTREAPITEPQREVWLADKISLQASLAYNESVSVQLTGELDVSALLPAVQALVDRHESLRCTISADGDKLRIASALDVVVGRHDFSALDVDARRAAVAKRQRIAVETPFDLEHGPLFRAELLTLEPARHLLIFTAHHIVCDGWSFGLLAKDLSDLYAVRTGATDRLIEAPESFADFATEQQTSLETAASNADETYWVSRFKGSLPVLELPTDRPRPRWRTTTAGRADWLLDTALVADVRKLGARHGASLFATLFVGFSTLLRRLSGQTDLVVGIAAAGQSAGGHDALVGHCVNILPVRTDVDPTEAFESALKSGQTTLLDAFDHQQFTFGTLLQKLAFTRDPSRLPLVTVLFNLDQRIDDAAVRFPGLAVEMSANARSFENFELFLNAVPVDDGLRLETQFNSDLYDAESVLRWMSGFEILLRDAVRAPRTEWSKLEWLSSAEAALLNSLQPAPSAYDATGLVHQRLTAHAQASPDRPALVIGERSVSYAELDGRSNAIAHVLRQRGVTYGSLVGLCLLREPDLYACVLGVLKAGGAFVPLDPAYPKDRLGLMIDDAELSLVLSKSDLLGNFDLARDLVVAIDADIDAAAWQRNDAVQLTAPLDPRSAAYVIYTSGSTGKPKGVMVHHQGLINLLTSMARQPGLVRDDRLVAVTTMSFDMSIPELFLPLFVGACAIIASRQDARDGESMIRLLEHSGATMMQATPSGWRLLIDAGWRGHPRFKALAGGEAVPVDLAAALIERCAEVWNMYGPTETTVWSACQRLHNVDAGVTIGTPIANTSIWILDDHQHRVPLGVPGEIWIGGDGVTLGYLNRPELTAQRFIPDPFSTVAQARLYRTGDRGRWRNDRTLEHLGRLDYQVKVRGYRIELGEIEFHLASQPGVERAVVITREDQPGDVRLVGYVVAQTTPSQLLEQLRKALPGYMVPHQLMLLDRIPLLPNGKIDRKALPKPGVSEVSLQADRAAPRTELEGDVLNSMELVLNLPGLGIRDDFFAMGGHSLLAARLTAQLNQRFSVALPMRTVFEASTAEQLASAIQAHRSVAQPKQTPIEHHAGLDTAPLTVMQERIRFMEQLMPGRVVYNTPSAHRLTGPMRVDAFQRAFDTLVQRQPSLRTVIECGEDGSYRQRVHAVIDTGIRFEDLSHLDPQQRETELLRRLQAVSDEPIDIFQLPLFRTALYRLSANEHVFLFVPHHVVWDGWSFDLLYQEMAALYGAALAGREVELPALRVTYLDYTLWHAQWMKGDEFQRQLRFWKDRYRAIETPRALPTDHPRQRGMTGIGAVEWVHVDTALTEALRCLARDCDATLNMLMMATYAAMLSEAVGAASLVLGIPVRGRLMADSEPVMGFFNNLLPAQLQVDTTLTLVDWVRHVKREMLDLFANQDVPFECLATEPEVAVHAQQAGLYQSLFSFQDARERPRAWGELQHRSVLVMQKGATEDFGLWLMEVPDGLEGGINYNADLFDRRTAEIFRDRLLGMLRRLVDRPAVTLRELLDADDPGRAPFYDWINERLQRGPEAKTVPLTAAEQAPALDAAQARLADLWARLLGIPVEQIQAGDNFFDLGGSSLLVMQAIAESATWLGVVDPRRYVYESLAQLATSHSPPRRDAQQAMAQIWADLLGVDVAQIGAEDNFFDLGGSSLLVMRAIDEANRRFGERLDPRRFVFENLQQICAGLAAGGPAARAPIATAETERTGLLSKVFGRFGKRA